MLDDRDQAILRQRIEIRDACPEPRVGDYVRFTTGRLALAGAHVLDPGMLMARY